MKKYRTKRVYAVRCKSGLMGWRTRLRNNYASFAEWVSNSELWSLGNRLGFNSEKAAWRANPVIEGSVNPSDYRRVCK